MKTAAIVAPTASSMLSPTAKKHHTPQTDLAIQELDNPFDDITEEKLVSAFRLRLDNTNMMMLGKY